jgi:hypothetical protein
MHRKKPDMSGRDLKLSALVRASCSSPQRSDALPKCIVGRPYLEWGIASYDLYEKTYDVSYRVRGMIVGKHFRGCSGAMIQPSVSFSLRQAGWVWPRVRYDGGSFKRANRRRLFFRSKVL